ncbi:DUF7108 domain-containing protein [Halobellus captivus]|uniref:DUF7108 domain-containing protein n=1 Tax=Halobellus captivus TaxID=2592614 RepID=UPI00119EE255|nr:rnhA operon protein [Halobellus captivus]
MPEGNEYEREVRGVDADEALDAAGAPDADGSPDVGGAPEVPEAVVDEAERLTRLAEEAAVEAAANAYREHRDELVEEHDFTARVREEDDTLVLYPDEWVDEGVVQFDRIEDTDRAVEVSLSGPDHGADWESVEEANQAVVDAVEARFGPEHAANVRAFADFMGNHYLKCIVDATPGEREEFLTEYYPRNVWPSKEQESIVDESVDRVADVSDDVPGA